MVGGMKKTRKYAQVTLELALAMSMVVLLFWATAQVFLYVNNRLVARQQYYESSPGGGRGVAGAHDVDDEVQVDETILPEVDFFY